MISINSNIDKVIKSFSGRYSKLKRGLDSIAMDMVQRMCFDMAQEISIGKYIWQEPNTKMETLPPIDFQIIDKGFNTIQVEIGNNLPLFIMQDGTLVNPVYFIEFGFGIAGEQSPAQNAEDFYWEYNLNGHTDYWYFKGLDKSTVKSKGVKGIGFMHNTIEKYRTEWIKYFNELIKEKA